MAANAPLEDDRGVDRDAIRVLLRLTPAERVQRLVDVVATWSAIRESVAPPPKDLAALPYLESLAEERHDAAQDP